MNKRPFTTTVVTHLRGAFFVALLVISINMIRFAQAQPQSNKTPQINSETSRDDVRGLVGAKTLVKVHDSSERTQIGSPQQSYTVTSPGSPPGTNCCVEYPRPHGQVA